MKNKPDQIAAVNKARWEEVVKEGAGCTIPWLDLDLDLLRQFATGELDPVPESLAVRGFAEKFPGNMLAGVHDKDVLCLGAGGGQQSAVFSLLGARVSVLDICEGQLEGDRRAAAHYGYDVTTIQGDMRDLSDLADESFDLVYGTGTCYIPDVHEVFVGVARVLRTEGIYRAGDFNPYTGFVEHTDWDGMGYRITKPHAQREWQRPDGMLEFRNYLDEVFNGLLDTGFSIQRVFASPRKLPSPKDQPGSYRHWEGAGPLLTSHPADVLKAAPHWSIS